MIGLYHLFALLVPLSYLPALILGRRRGLSSALGLSMIWLPVVVGAVWIVFFLGGHWIRSFTATLWVTVAVSSLLFASIAVRSQAMRDVVILFHPYMFCMSIIAAAWQHAEPPMEILSDDSVELWLWIHIISAVVTYGLLTITAVVALGVILKERALKRKAPNSFSQQLPAVVVAEALQRRLLLVAEIVLALGLMTGMATQYWLTGDLIVVGHKSFLSVAAFAVIGVLLLAEYRLGVRGRRASQTLLLAYLLVTLGFPGVKFVSDILMR